MSRKLRSKESKIRHAVESLVSAFLFLFQHIPVAGPWFGLMTFPLAAYIFGFFWSLPEFRGEQIYLLLFSPRLMFGRIVAISGFVIFVIALVQLLKERETLVTGGLYSVVRHPQYLGIIIMTLGLTIMSAQFRIGGADPKILYTWLIQVFGYVLLAGYEERHLLNEYEKEYQQYRQRVSFILPMSLNKIPEQLLTLVTALIIAFLLTLI